MPALADLQVSNPESQMSQQFTIVASSLHTAAIQSMNATILADSVIPTSEHLAGVSFTMKGVDEKSIFTEMNKILRGPMLEYQHLIQKQSIKSNIHQFNAVKLLQNLHDELKNYDPQPTQTIQKTVNVDLNVSPDFKFMEQVRPSIFDKLRNYIAPPKKSVIHGPRGLYIYGSVGTGYHHDPIPSIANEIVMEYWLLCFDEFQVTDIADAMILKRLYSEMFDNGAVLVATSNRHPTELYENGIQRSSFLPAIAMLQEKCTVHCLDSGLDFRKQEQETIPVYFKIKDSKIETLFKALTAGQQVEKRVLKFWGRTLEINQASGRICKVSFQELCQSNKSAADYLQLASEFDVVMVENIPALDIYSRNEARRLITLIDALYDQKVKLIASFETSLSEIFSGDAKDANMQSADRLLFDDLKLNPEQLKSSIFTGHEEVFAFQRCVSRLVEMQGKRWIGDELSAKIIKALS